MKHLLVLMMAGLLVAATAPSAQAEGTLERIEKRGGVNLGYREDRPPISFRNEQGEVVGYAIDLCLRVVASIKDKLGRPDLAVTYVPVTAENRFQQIQDGAIDVLCGPTTKTLARQEQVDFTNLTFVTGGTLMSLADKPVPGIAGLQGKKVAVVEGTTTIETLRERLKAALSDAEVLPVATAQEGLDALVAGTVDAFASDQVVLIGLVLTSTSDQRFAISKELFSFEPFALAVPRNDADFRLVANAALAQLYRSGEITLIYQRWFTRFGKEVPDLLQALYRLNATPE